MVMDVDVDMGAILGFLTAFLRPVVLFFGFGLDKWDEERSWGYGWMVLICWVCVDG